jgi:hypothetical protein
MKIALAMQHISLFDVPQSSDFSEGNGNRVAFRKGPEAAAIAGVRVLGDDLPTSAASKRLQKFGLKIGDQFVPVGLKISG